ncbi:site-2 protease family protein [Gloeothece verrucosa]|uniref:Zinc metalloprotease n=1 Tax=Gloeothece verrucosa (strain PCC 7822) TaxID=497965 RepID=E0UIN1_GLOV7|nr:site-2 protease family protein [Gloeothece verrucosa]ADN12225.1 peptidase M50 [Gloeothece verrucosa PCC 7822]
MRAANWRIGSLFGIPIYIDSSWFLILLLITIINAGDVNAMELSQVSPALGWLTGLMMALLLFASVLLHELGHSLVARSQGISVKSITLFLFGGIASIERESYTPTEAFWVAIAGPMVSLVLFALFFGLTKVWESSPILELITSDLARINLVLVIFNLIPGLPLDGGQVLKAIVWKMTGDRFTGVRWASASGKLIGGLGIVFGLFLVLASGELGAIWLSLIGWFVLKNAKAYDDLTLLQQSLLELVAADVMTREFRVVNANLTLREFIEEYVVSQLGLGTSNTYTYTYYAASEGRYRGLLRVSQLQLIERSQWSNQRLIDIVHPLTEIPSVQEKTPLVQVVKELEKIREPAITVLSPAGAVAGVIDRADVVKAIALKNHLSISETEIKRIKTERTYPAYLQLGAIANTILQQDLPKQP